MGWMPEARGGLACTEGGGASLVERSWPSSPTIWDTSLLDACKSDSLSLLFFGLELLLVPGLFLLLQLGFFLFLLLGLALFMYLCLVGLGVSNPLIFFDFLFVSSCSNLIMLSLVF